MKDQITHAERDFWERVVDTVAFDPKRTELPRVRAGIAAHTASKLVDALRARRKIGFFHQTSEETPPEEELYWCSDAARYVGMRLGAESNLLFVDQCAEYADGLLHERRARNLPSYQDPCTDCEALEDEDDDETGS